MPPSRDLPDRDIQKRKAQMYETDAVIGSHRPFAEYLRETPPAPLSLLTKASLIAAGVVVGLVFLLTLYRSLSPKPQPPRPPETSVRVQPPGPHA